MAEKPEENEVVRWYTRARRFPRLIGKTPSGGVIWGGPYTLTQVAGFLVTLVGGWWLLSVLALFGFIGNVIITATASAAVVIGLGNIPLGGRNPLTWLVSLIHFQTGPSSGKIRGRRVRLPRPHRVHHQMRVAITTPAARRQAEPSPTMKGTLRPSTAGLSSPAGSRLQVALAALNRTTPPVEQPPQGVIDPTATDSTSEPTDTAPLDAAPPRPARRRPALTGVQALLAGSAPAGGPRTTTTTSRSET